MPGSACERKVDLFDEFIVYLLAEEEIAPIARRHVGKFYVLEVVVGETGYTYQNCGFLFGNKKIIGSPGKNHFQHFSVFSVGHLLPGLILRDLVINEPA
ncbi:MAG: hypothetical protein JXR89_05445, partial [Deltaproteobacteria bacterium]|nr:hypothetical protein [Deltaproteobacteria bacterium]